MEINNLSIFIQTHRLIGLYFSWMYETVVCMCANKQVCVQEKEGNYWGKHSLKKSVLHLDWFLSGGQVNGTSDTKVARSTSWGWAHNLRQFQRLYFSQPLQKMSYKKYNSSGIPGLICPKHFVQKPSLELLATTGYEVCEEQHHKH